MNLEPSYICLFVSNLEESINFYQNILGLSIIPHLTTDNFKAFKYGPLVLGLEKNGFRADGEKDKEHNPIILQFKSASEEALREQTVALKKLGVPVVQENTQYSFGIVTSFLDPDGNRLELLYQ